MFLTILDDIKRRHTGRNDLVVVTVQDERRYVELLQILGRIGSVLALRAQKNDEPSDRSALLS
jgi:hypothetical protein